VNHLDLAVSQTSDPTGDWNFYKIDVTHDGTDTGGKNPGPYLGDYPHIGAGANGIYLTTNAYPWHANGFSGAQIYALSKAQLAAGASSVTMQHIDTSGMVNAPSEAGSTQQVIYANGKLWGALDTALNPDGGPQRAGVAWYIVNPATPKVTLSGYLGASGHDFTYPAIGVTASGRGVMAFTDTGDATYPSAAYAPIDAVAGVGAWNDVPGGLGAAADDGFSGYKQQNAPNPIRSRWGDYGAAAVDGNSVWIASEYIAHTCGYTDWGGPFFTGGTGDNLLGTCGGASHGPGPRTALANWSTRISKMTP
jgi:hypothetical protein